MATTLTKLSGGAGSRNGERSYREEYLLVSDAALTEAEARTASGVPEPGDVKDGDDWAAVSDVIAEPMSQGDTKHWRIIVQYTTDKRFTQPETPTLRTPELRISTVTGTESFFYDTTGRPVVNSAGEAFDEQPVRDASNVSIQFTRYETDTDFKSRAAYLFVQTVNNEAVTLWGGLTIAAKAGKLSAVDAERIEDNGIFWRVTYTIDIRDVSGNAPGWDLVLLDYGYSYLDTNLSNTKLLPILNEAGEPVSKPFPMNGVGGYVLDNDPAELDPWKPYKEVSWSGLSLSSAS